MSTSAKPCVVCENLRGLIRLLLDQVDYTAGACRPSDMVAAVLPVEIIDQARVASALSAPGGGA